MSSTSRTVSARLGDLPQALASGEASPAATARSRSIPWGMDDLAVAGSHGFDIWIPGRRSVSNERLDRFADLIESVTRVLRAEVASIPGSLVEPKVDWGKGRSAPEVEKRQAPATQYQPSVDEVRQFRSVLAT